MGGLNRPLLPVAVSIRIVDEIMCDSVYSQQSEAVVICNQHLVDNKYLLRLQVEDIALKAEPGHFVHLNCHPSLTLPRPFSIMDSDPGLGTIDIFYQVVGDGTEYMRGWQAGHRTTMLGPLGRPFRRPESGRKALLIAGGIGYAPLDFFARRLKIWGFDATLLLGLEAAPPFALIASSREVGPEMVVDPLALARLEQLDIPSRVASLEPKPGFFQGYVSTLAKEILLDMSTTVLNKTDIYLCGPTPMMQAAARVAKEFNLGGQASLEEHMACGFGGCAGCVAPIKEPEDAGGWNYRRVCTEGPVFPLDAVLWDKL